MNEMASTGNFEGVIPGDYGLEAELSCYLPAMGGCDFGQGLLESAVLTVTEDNTTTITLDFKELVTVTMLYGDATSYVAEGETAYYDGSGWVEADYTTQTAVSSEISSMSGETEGQEIEYTYIDTMTFPVTEMAESYTLAVNVGGTQFGGETAYTLSSTGESLSAELVVNWETAELSYETAATQDSAGDSEIGVTPVIPVVIVIIVAAIIVAAVGRKKKKA